MSATDGTSSGLVGAAEIASLVDALAAHIEGQHEHADDACQASQQSLEQLLRLAPSQLEDPKGHPLLSKLWGVVGQQLAQESGSAFHQAEDLTADGVTDPLCSPSAAQAFLEPLVNAEGVAACIMQTRDVVAAQAAAINWDNDSLLKVDARRQSFQRPDILTFSDSDSDDDADDGGRLRRRSSSHARLSRASGGSLPAGGISLLLGSMDDSDDDLDLDFGPDIGKLVADLESAETRLAALKKLTSSRVYAEDLCYGPSWQQLFDSLTACLMPVRQGTSSELSTSKAAQAGAAPLAEPHSPDNGSKRPAHDSEVRQLACQVLLRLVPECNGGSPQHAAHLLLALAPVLAHLEVTMPSPQPDASDPLNERLQQSAGLGDSLLQHLQEQSPIDAQLVRQAHKLLVGISKDWHLIKAATQARVATFICSLLAACLQPSTQHTGTDSSTADAAAGASAGKGAVLHAPLLLVQMDRNLHWLQRLCAAASSCKAVLKGAAEARLHTSILAALQHMSGSGDAAASSDAAARTVAGGSLVRYMACMCAACLVTAPACEGAEFDVGHSALAQGLMNAFCSYADAQQAAQQAEPPGVGSVSGVSGCVPESGPWDHRCPCWVLMLCNVAHSSPHLLAGVPLQRLLSQLLALSKEGPEQLQAAGESGGGWWLDATATLLHRLEASQEGRRALLACTPQPPTSQLRTPSSSVPGAAAAAGGAGAGAAADTPLVLSLGLSLIDVAAKAGLVSAAGAEGGSAGRLLCPAARSCLCTMARLLGGSALQLRRAGQLADAALRLIKFGAAGSNAGGSSGGLGVTARRSGAVTAAGFGQAGSGGAAPTMLLDASTDADSHAASSIAADVLVCLCGTPLSALYVCRRPAAANAAARRLCQLLASAIPSRKEAMPGHQALAEVKRRRADGAAHQLPHADEELVHSALLTASTLALCTAGQQALITQGLPAVMRSWLESTSECPDLALALQRPPTDSSALAPLMATQSIMCWHHLVANLASCLPGQELLRLLVTWLDNNPGVKPPPSRGLTPALGFRGAGPSQGPPSHAAGPDCANGAYEGTVLAPGLSASHPAPPPRSPEACHLALRCLMLVAHDIESLLTLETATNARWYLQQLLDTAYGPAVDLRMAGILMEGPVLPVTGGGSGSGGSNGVAPAGAPAAAGSNGRGSSTGDTTSQMEAATLLGCIQGLDVVLDMDTPGARYLVARLDMLGPPVQPEPTLKQAAGKAPPRGRPPSTPGALLDVSADHLAQVVRGDAGMVEPGVWLAAVRQALIMDVQLPTLSPAAVALMLQRLVMVALHSPSRQLQGLAEAAWAPTCQSPAPVGMQLRGQARGDREVPAAHQFVSWSCVRAALGTQPTDSLPGFSLDLALAAPTELLAAAGHVLTNAGAGLDPLLPYQLLGTYLRELLRSPASAQAPLAALEAAAEVMGLAPVELAGTHARLCLEVGSRSAGHKGDGQGSGSDGGVPTGPSHPSMAAQGMVGGPPLDMFLLWLGGVMQGFKPITVDLLADLTKSPAAAYWWPWFGTTSQGDVPRLALCTALQVVLEAAEPSLWGACMAAEYHPCHAASRWLDACFFSFLPPAEASKAMALAIGLGPDYLVYCCVAMLKHMELELLRWQALYGLLPQGLHCRLLPDYSVAANLQYMLGLEKQFRPQVLALLFPGNPR